MIKQLRSSSDGHNEYLMTCEEKDVSIHMQVQKVLLEGVQFQQRFLVVVGARIHI